MYFTIKVLANLLKEEFSQKASLNAAERIEALEKLIDKQLAVLDIELQVGKMKSWPESRYRQELKTLKEYRNQLAEMLSK